MDPTTPDSIEDTWMGENVGEQQGNLNRGVYTPIEASQSPLNRHVTVEDFRNITYMDEWDNMQEYEEFIPPDETDELMDVEEHRSGARVNNAETDPDVLLS